MFDEPYSLKQVFSELKSKLEGIYGPKEANSIASLLLNDSIPDFTVRLIADPGMLLAEDTIKQIFTRLDDLLKHRPLQYVLGKTDFYGLDLALNESVLIPRPETEELVDLIIKESQNPASILDIGTGSGCIAIALAAEMRASKVEAMDVSGNALRLASENALRNSVEIRFIQDNILKPAKEYLQYDLIVSNPPYVLEKEKNLMHKNVLEFEPHLALFVDNDDPLLFYIAIAGFACKHLNDKGKLYFEVNEKYGRQVSDLLLDSGFRRAEVIKDLSGKDRFVKASK